MLVDQRRLPVEEVERAYGRWEDVADAIRTLVVRGAPAIGVAAAFGAALAARQSRATTFVALLADLETALKGLAATRPTAVNLFWALERIRRLALASDRLPLDQVRAGLLAEAQAIRDEDIAANRALGAHGAALVPANARILTHCNAGALATARFGTALGVIRAAHALGVRARGNPAHADRRCRGRLAHGAGSGGPDRHGRGPDRRQRRHGEQDRHLRAGRARPPPPGAVLRRRAVLDDRPHAPVG